MMNVINNKKDFLSYCKAQISKDINYNLFDVCRLNLEAIYVHFDYEMGKDNYDIDKDFKFGMYFLNYLNSVDNFVNYHNHMVDQITIPDYKDAFNKMLDNSINKPNSYTSKLLNILKDTYTNEESYLSLKKYHDVILKKKLLYKDVNLLELLINAFLEVLKYDSEINNFIHRELLNMK